MEDTYPFRDRNSVHQLYAHLIFVVKYRAKSIDENLEKQLEPVFERECDKLECRMIHMKSDRDHVHVLVQFPPKVALAQLVNQMKGVSSREINRDREKRGASKFVWSPSYFVKTVGSKILVQTHNYVSDQREKPNRRTFRRR